ncbi:hypothetical protein D3H55_15730 [Bacillus salacetis]|uniref:Uncharacterized protein n=1 Tax=Bacillus salacetis TaxID=2315464 RepID=A0A3A1QYD3_9BACI|nr:hypothetical protein D3H55_15730 [Bacillus salacetis]
MAVFAYIVAFGKIPGAGFFPSTFLSCLQGFFTTIYQDIIFEKAFLFCIEIIGILIKIICLYF